MYKPVAAGLLTARAMAAKASYPHEDDYTSLTDLNIEIDEENGTFFMCFWLYILGSFTTPPVTIIQQLHTDIEGNTPFLLLNKEKKLMLFPFKFLLEESCQHGTYSEVPCACTEIEYPFNKWVHVGCE
ncbi:Sh2 domain-containing protein a, partial [Thalictrum thalictroides]